MYTYTKTEEGKLRIEGNDEPTREFWVNQIRDVIANTENHKQKCLNEIAHLEALIATAEASAPINAAHLAKAIELECVDAPPAPHRLEPEAEEQEAPAIADEPLVEGVNSDFPQE